MADLVAKVNKKREEIWIDPNIHGLVKNQNSSISVS